jgi:hypothetical protein
VKRSVRIPYKDIKKCTFRLEAKPYIKILSERGKCLAHFNDVGIQKSIEKNVQFVPIFLKSSGAGL